MVINSVEAVVASMKQAAGLYHRLVLLVASSGSGKTAVLQEVVKRTNSPRINLNLELSKRLLELPSRQRVLRVRDLIDGIIDEVGGESVLLDNIELLFDRTLQQDPLRLLQSISRNRTLVAAWNGTLEGGQLIYATPDHHDYRRYPTHEALIVRLEPTS